MCHSDRWGAMKTENALLCLPLSAASKQEAHVCSSWTKRSGAFQATSDTNKDKEIFKYNIQSMTPLPSSEVADGLSFSLAACSTSCTNKRSLIDEDCLSNAQTRSLKRKLLRTMGTPIFCTLMKTKMNVYPHSVRLCHSKSSSDQNSVEAQLTHTDAQGRASMVDIGGKAATQRTATATATVILGPTAFRLLRNNQLAKGDALAVAQLSGIMASKQTSALIPLCHPLPLDHTSVTFDLDESRDAAVITATCRTTGRTGVEMEALTAASVAALTVYDMCKAVSHDITITDIKLVSKMGGKRDFHRHPRPSPSRIHPNEEKESN